jgi:hypothetical protein
MPVLPILKPLGKESGIETPRSQATVKEEIWEKMEKRCKLLFTKPRRLC